MTQPPTESPTAEVARTPPPADNSRIARGASAVVQWIARHWLACFNIGWAAYAFVPFLAPLFIHWGWEGPARAIYFLYSFTCHQLPDHSYFLFGPWHAPHADQLVAAGMPATPNLLIERQFIGNDEIGWKVALCQRDVAIYGGVFLAGIVFALVRSWLHPLPGKWFLVAMIPIALDGGSQLIGLRESNWLLRTITGSIFGIAAVWWAYPYVHDAMNDVLAEEAQRSKTQASQMTKTA